MRLCNDTITVYNSYLNEDKRKEYLPTIISGVHWFGTEKVSVTSDGLVGATQYTIRIPKEANFSGKHFVSPKKYESSTDKSKLFTLNEGDTIVHGVATEEGTEAKPATLQSRYDEVVTTISVTDNRNAPNAKHWRVVCK